MYRRPRYFGGFNTQVRTFDAGRCILTAARLVTPYLDKLNWAAGYQWAIDILRPSHESIANELEIDLAINYLKKKHFDKAS